MSKNFIRVLVRFLDFAMGSIFLIITPVTSLIILFLALGLTLLDYKLNEGKIDD